MKNKVKIISAMYYISKLFFLYQKKKNRIPCYNLLLLYTNVHVNLRKKQKGQIRSCVDHNIDMDVSIKCAHWE
ncbi:hypothetical protein PFNF54_04322 [Plasmodium falciparum NF54]|uniref:Uncharacterized protein n=1 Tax=Plasmodium falciparum (isolate NF54) TaxID=5843 RepID=W7K0C4_PLAFO|nr:hypothetical protein PFNF54_04322 [Plasmodium falciparum NF54]